MLYSIIRGFRKLSKSKGIAKIMSKDERDRVIKHYMKEAMIDCYELRADVSSEFIIAVNKENGDYENIYRKYIPSCTREEFAEVVSKMDKHRKYEN